jgi:hypothetical protein
MYRVYAINVVGPLLCSQAAAAHQCSAPGCMGRIGTVLDPGDGDYPLA